MPERKYRMVENKGVNAVVLNKKRVLLLKRISLPFIIHPGYWAFVSGAKKKNENYLETAYREVEEETGIKRNDLKLLLKGGNITIMDDRRATKWTNRLFVFGSKGKKVRLNIENTSYKWVSLKGLEEERNITLNHFSNREKALNSIRKCLKM